MLNTIRWLADGTPVSATEALDVEHSAGAMRLVFIHGLAAALYSALHSADAEAPTHYPKLRRAYHVAAARTAVLTEQTRECIETLRGAGVQALLLKGNDTGLTLYQDPAHRYVSDIDMLLREEDVPRAVQALENIGYRRETTTFSREEEWLCLMYLGGLTLVRGEIFPLELHCSVLRGYGSKRNSIADLWSSPLTVSVAGMSVGVLPRELCFIASALHLFSNDQRSVPYLKTAADLLLLSRAIEREGDWDRMWHAAEAWGVASEIRGVAAFMNRSFEARIPRVDGATPPFTANEIVYVLERLQGRSRLSEGLTLRLRMLQYLPGFGARVRYLLRFAFPRPEYLRWRYKLPAAQPLFPYYIRHLTGGFQRLVKDIAIRTSSGRR